MQSYRTVTHGVWIRCPNTLCAYKCAYPSKEFLEMQIMGALKHSSEDTDSIQQNNSLPKIFDETYKIQKNARMLVEKSSVLLTNTLQKDGLMTNAQMMVDRRMKIQQ